MSGLIFSKENCLSHYKWGDNCDGWNFVDTDELSIKQEVMPRQTQEQLHFHKHATQFFFILSGMASFLIDEQLVTVATQQGLEIKPGQQHRIMNKGDRHLEFILYSYPSTKNDRINVG